jgi:hypothetical protein
MRISLEELYSGIKRSDTGYIQDPVPPQPPAPISRQPSLVSNGVSEPAEDLGSMDLYEAPLFKIITDHRLLHTKYLDPPLDL